MSAFKDVVMAQKAQAEILEGVEILSEAVRVTMGPRGKNVLIERPGTSPHLTKDGVTVANCINLRDKYKNLGVQVIKEAAARTAETAGDGTTTATVLGHAIYSSGLKMISSGFKASELISGIKKAAKIVDDELKAMSRPLEGENEIVQVGTISANGDEKVGRIISEAMNEVGKDGTISVEDAKGFQTSLAVVNGTQLDRGFVSPYFVTDQAKMVCDLDNPYVLLYGSKINNIQDILPLLEELRRSSKPLLIVADEIEGDAMQGLVLNRLKGILEVCVIRSPEFGTTRLAAMEDLSILTGGKFINDLDDLRSAKLEHLGRCRKATISKSQTVLIGCHGNDEEIQKRSDNIAGSLENPTLEKAEILAIRRRLSRLASGVAVIRVGGSTEVEMKEKKDRIDDALAATKAAVKQGVLPGGGTALVRASKKVMSEIKSGATDKHVGMRVLAESCQAPLRQIVDNLGISSDLVIEKVLKLKGNHGFDARKEKFIDLVEGGILDPTMVVRCALSNSVSSACSLLSVGAAIVNDDLGGDKNFEDSL